jgi:UDP-N-acetylglucosamine/UDP-N-acetylgalactosamine diphosphorylase
MNDYETQRKRYDAAGQGHVFQFYDQLGDDAKNKLVASAAEIDIKRASRIFKLATSSNTTPPSDNVHDDLAADLIRPPPEDTFASTLGDDQAGSVREWRRVGLEAIASNRVGVLLMAGGQGTRLGSSDPKGCYDIGLPSHKPLFQIQAERILRLQTVAESELGKPKGSVVIPWYVMTSGPTRASTEAFFNTHDFFGLDRKNVIIFEQGYTSIDLSLVVY